MEKEPTQEEIDSIHREFEDVLNSCINCQDDESKFLIRKAFKYAYDAHFGIARNTGEQYIFHPLAVARIVGNELLLDKVSVISALLHDVVEDTAHTLDEIKESFGEEIARIIECLTKIEDLYDEESNLQAENFKKIMSSIPVDIRVILIKLADRLHNMRTLDGMIENKQLQKAGEVLYIYAPLAHRLGLYKIKAELEDISFRFRHPSEYEAIANSINLFGKQRLRLIDKIKPQIEQVLHANNLKFNLEGKLRSIYSSWKQMRDKNIAIEEVPNLLTIRVVFEANPSLPEKTNCWNVYALIGSIFPTNTEKIVDFVNYPRTNGYEALHGTILVDNIWIPIQILTNRMLDIAERGYTIHRNYAGENKTELDKWIDEIKEALENPAANSAELLEDLRKNLYPSDIYIFTPKGHVKTLPKGSTVLDFAYYLHTQIGNKCIGAYVNHESKKLDHVLKSGDEVKVLTLDSRNPDIRWLDIVITARAKTALKNYFRIEKNEEILRGKAIIDKIILELALPNEAVLINKIYEVFKYNFKDELYYKIGSGIISEEDIRIIFTEKQKTKTIDHSSLTISKFMTRIGLKKAIEEAPKINKKATLKLNDLFDSSNFIFETCCEPIPGEEVIGYQTTSGPIAIHKRDCPEAVKLNANSNYNIVAVEWTTHKLKFFLVRLFLKGRDRQNLLKEIADIISEKGVNIKSVHINSEDNYFQGMIDLYVHCIEDLNNIIKELKKLKGVDTAKRVHLSFSPVSNN